MSGGAPVWHLALCSGITFGMPVIWQTICSTMNRTGVGWVQGNRLNQFYLSCILNFFLKTTDPKRASSFSSNFSLSSPTICSSAQGLLQIDCVVGQTLKCLGDHQVFCIKSSPPSYKLSELTHQPVDYLFNFFESFEKQ